MNTPTEKDYLLLAKALYIATTDRQQADDIADDLYDHNTHTEKLSIADKLSMADMLILIARNYHSKLRLEIHNVENAIECSTDFSNKKEIQLHRKAKILARRLNRSQKKLDSAADYVYDNYQDYLTDELESNGF
jgi:hypothetical protein